jgi:hypothetical protein
MRFLIVLALVTPPVAVAARAAPAQWHEEARPQDVEALQAEIRNLDDELAALEPGDPRADEFRKRAEDIREEAIYLKVKMRRRQEDQRPGTGVMYGEVAELQRAVTDLRRDIGRASPGPEHARELRIPASTRLTVQLEEGLTSRTARREDRVYATVFRPLRFEGRLAVPAGTRVRGVVVDAEPAQRPSKGGRLEIRFNRLDLDNERIDFRGRVVSIEDEREDRTVGKAGIGAVLGGVIGGLFGGGKGAVVGVLLGGTSAVVATKGDEVNLPAGTVLTVDLEEPLVIPLR